LQVKYDETQRDTDECGVEERLLDHSLTGSTQYADDGKTKRSGGRVVSSFCTHSIKTGIDGNALVESLMFSCNKSSERLESQELFLVVDLKAPCRSQAVPEAEHYVWCLRFQA
jgi:hypothetical protein